MDSVIKVLTSDLMVVVYEAAGILIFGGLDIFLGKKKKAAKLDNEKAAVQEQERKLKQSLMNMGRR